MPSPAAVAHLAGGEPRSMLPIGGGRNSQVFRVDAADGHTYALKAYFRHPGDPRDRLGTEFGALRFLWEQGLRNVPKTIAFDPVESLGLYEFIEGTRPEPASMADVEAAAGFLASLRPLRETPGATHFQPASEATFSLQALVESIQGRLDRFGAVEADLLRQSGLQAFLQEELEPAWAAIREHAHRQASAFPDELPLAARVLSPSDFGFHNALRRQSGLVFLDFEYFGWDDPAKLLVDFLLHPGMNLGLELKQRFAENLLRSLPLEGLRARARLVFPLFGIKWCLIMLNEFLPGALHRRAFADQGSKPNRERQMEQLAKTRIKLQQLLDDHAHFPYFHP